MPYPDLVWVYGILILDTYLEFIDKQIDRYYIDRQINKIPYSDFVHLNALFVYQ